MGSHLYKKLKVELLMILSVLIIIFIVFLIIGSYIFSYNSSYEYVNIGFIQAYENIKSNFDERDFNYTDNEIKEIEDEKIEKVINDFFNGYIIKKFYTIKKLDDGNIVYLTYSEKGSDNDKFRNGKSVDKDILKNAEKIYSNKEKIVYDTPDLFSDEEVIKYMYSIPDAENNIAGILGLEIDMTEVKMISTETFLKAASTFIIIVLLFSTLLSILFYKIFRRAFNTFVYTDALTKLKNRAAYEEYIININEKIKSSFDYSKEKIYLIVFDLNDLKFVNDTFGHIAGDEYIKSAGNIIDKVFCDIGFTYRTGGDEFVSIIVNSVSDDVINEKILKLTEYEKEYNNENRSYVMSISVGYDSFKEGYDLNLISVLKRADEKMYEDKKMKKLRAKENKDSNII